MRALVPTALAVICVGIGTILPLACGKKSTEEDVPGGQVSVKFISSQLKPAALALADEVLASKFNLSSNILALTGAVPCSSDPSCPCNTQTNMCIATQPESNSSLVQVGQSSQTTLESLSYRLGYVSLANSLTLQGSGFSNPLGEWIIFNDTSGDANTPGAAETDTKFVNLLEKAGLANLARQLTYTKSNINKYNYAIINWFQGIRFKATVTLSDGTLLYSKKSTSYKPLSSSAGETQYSSNTSTMTTSPAEESVVFSNNGGTLFKLQTPFEITQDDYDAKTAFKIAFAFDPDGLIKGIKQEGVDAGTLNDEKNGYKIQTPYLDMAPIAARESETILRDTYLLRSVDIADPFDVKLSLYYIKEDSSKGIRAVNKTVFRSAAIPLKSASNGANTRIDSTTTNADGTVTFRDSDGAAVFKNFKKLASVGDTGTVSAGFCKESPSCTTDATLAYTLVSTGTIEGELTAIAVTPSPSPSPTPKAP